LNEEESRLFWVAKKALFHYTIRDETRKFSPPSLEFFQMIRRLFLCTLLLLPLVALPAHAEEGAIQVAAVGDIMMGADGRLPADGGASLFTAMPPFLEGVEVVFGNHEGVLADCGKPTKGEGKASYCFRTPPEYGRHLRAAGFNMMSVANNHIYDYGEEAKAETLITMTLNGIAYSGPPGTAGHRTFHGLKVGLIAFHTSSHSNHLNNTEAACAFIAEEAAKNDILIVSFHGGAEGNQAIHVPRGPETFYGEDRGDLRMFTHAAIDAGADLVLGHGPHVPRAMELYRGRLIAYSLGNFCTGIGINVKGYTGLAPLLLADLAADGRLVGGRIVSFLQTYGRPPKLDPMNRAANLIYRLGEEDFPGKSPVTRDGRLDPARVTNGKNAW
jgi:hypothetical protein